MTHANGKIIRSTYLASQNRSYAIIRYHNSYVVETMDVRTDEREEISRTEFNPHTPGARAAAYDAALTVYKTAHHNY